ncbi:hypothetical protein FAD94_000840 [Enterococcus faecalis]|uniref:hypothetical protein n=1 Tax=Enterococcus faecalis TaxID=1351 RepID=UPI00094EBDDE|nr:hypothetical protein [Enterococcus faecalis]EGO8125837.1 hypothetical protein [Enterococcus faecalis]EGO8292570.1 hypothetical protein [Enterococcus faecalis]EGO8433907.1 hypothetical protein [Enterococcus faecalis]EGO8495110.1 hypothetical protein [Enterococcus faecalis]EHB5063961.1 hypothetical protein [Enterococcus faecalis]
MLRRKKHEIDLKRKELLEYGLFLLERQENLLSRIKDSNLDNVNTEVHIRECNRVIGELERLIFAISDNLLSFRPQFILWEMFKLGR